MLGQSLLLTQPWTIHEQIARVFFFFCSKILLIDTEI